MSICRISKGGDNLFEFVGGVSLIAIAEDCFTPLVITDWASKTLVNDINRVIAITGSGPSFSVSLITAIVNLHNLARFSSALESQVPSPKSQPLNL
jgi:hypothetical protein